jgi:hypothetical protein
VPVLLGPSHGLLLPADYEPPGGEGEGGGTSQSPLALRARLCCGTHARTSTPPAAAAM